MYQTVEPTEIFDDLNVVESGLVFPRRCQHQKRTTTSKDKELLKSYGSLTHYLKGSPFVIRGFTDFTEFDLLLLIVRSSIQDSYVGNCFVCLIHIDSGRGRHGECSQGFIEPSCWLSWGEVMDPSWVAYRIQVLLPEELFSKKIFRSVLSEIIPGYIPAQMFVAEDKDRRKIMLQATTRYGIGWSSWWWTYVWVDC